jgi:hypothetical protein
MDFVWIYVHGPSAWRKIGLFNELEYSIRSVKKNCKDARCIVVGDTPEVSFDDVIHITGPPRHEQGNVAEMTMTDQINKFIEISNNPEISDEFVLMYDDIFILKPTTVDELKINWARQEVTDIDQYLTSKTRGGSNSYKKQWRYTYEFIKMIRSSDGKKTYDWETHTPRYFDKEKLRTLLDKWDLKANEMLTQALYDCYHAENTEIINAEIQTDLYTHKPGMDFDKLLDVQYLNIYDNVIVPEFIETMKRLLG